MVLRSRKDSSTPGCAALRHSRPPRNLAVPQWTVVALQAQQGTHLRPLPAWLRLPRSTLTRSKALERGDRLVDHRSGPGPSWSARARRSPARLLVVEGWAARVRFLPDGRRQFLRLRAPRVS
jgi:hypothetical protein